jgi:ABC-type Fe3+ transport system substrate-binding protein
MRAGSTALLALLVWQAAPALAADQALIDAARKEGAVTWYTTQIIDQFARPASEAFQKKYGIKVTPVRSDNAQTALRILNEGAAGRLQADVIDGTASSAALVDRGFIMKWQPDGAARLGKQFVDPKGFWTATNLYIMTPGFNTNLVPKGSEPRTYEELLDPKWKGRIAWSGPSSSYQTANFVGLILAAMGDQKGRDYLQKLGKQSITEVSGSARQVLDLTMAGEYPLALMIFNHHTIISAKLGAPTAWIPMQPALATLSIISVTQGSRNPNAGKLLVDYLISPEGQRLFRDAGYIPVDPDVPPLNPELRPDGKTFNAIFMNPEELQQGLPEWKKVHEQYFR